MLIFTMIQSWKAPLFLDIPGHISRCLSVTLVLQNAFIFLPREGCKEPSKRREDLCILPFQSFECSCVLSFIPNIHHPIHTYIYIYYTNTVSNMMLHVGHQHMQISTPGRGHFRCFGVPKLSTSSSAPTSDDNKNGIKPWRDSQCHLGIPFHKPDHIDCIYIYKHETAMHILYLYR